jgi:hypothetical protein
MPGKADTKGEAMSLAAHFLLPPFQGQRITVAKAGQVL